MGGLGGHDILNVYRLLEQSLMNYPNYISKYNNGKIILTNEDRRHSGEEFILPTKVKSITLE
jgi:hypothetical protein